MLKLNYFILLILLLFSIQKIKAKSEFLRTSRQLGGCPVCDSSVYSYCDYKIHHDACCCSAQITGQSSLTPGCQYTNCSVFYAKSCYEHLLIKTCCCENPYQKK